MKPNQDYYLDENDAAVMAQAWQTRKSLVCGHYTPSFASSCVVLKYKKVKKIEFYMPKDIQDAVNSNI